MRAFLSHSSKDKVYVRQVADLLGDAQCEYDERTFDFTFNVDAIRRALGRSDLFVYFLSGASIHSSFVTEEQRAALEKRGAGAIKRVLVVSVDETSYRALPEWLREINVLQRISSPKICARKIQALLLRLDAEYQGDSEIYLGREIEDAAIRKVLSGPRDKTPIALHVVGHYGVGRKTFLRKNLQALFPRRFDTFPEIAVSANHGIEDLFRQLHGLTASSSLENTIRVFEEFSSKDSVAQVLEVSKLIQEMRELGEFLLISDDGGVYTEEGDYQNYIKSIISKIDGKGLPALGFIQTRMMPAIHKERNLRSFHQYISALDDRSTRELLGLLLKQLDVDYAETQINVICEMLDGHPFNVKFAAAFSHDYGIETLIADPVDLVEWKRKRAEDFLGVMAFSNAEADVLAALSEYRYLAPEALFSVLEYRLIESAAAIRRLQEFSCVERREGYCHIAPPLRDGIRRDPRFRRDDQWKQNLGRKICETIAEYLNEDQVSVSILDSATLAAAKDGSSAPAFLSALILPSHLLRIARDHYDAGRRLTCIEFCERAWSSRTRLPHEAQLEILRLWGLSAVRINDEGAYRLVLEHFQQFRDRTGERIRLFVEAFYYRIHKDLDKAEKNFLAAWRLSKNNHSINREIASLLVKQRRYDEAERYARGAYEQAPTNPFLIDVLVDVLLGKRQQGLHVDERELSRAMADLERYGDAPGSSFFLVRKAQAELAEGKYRTALATINRAVERTPALLNAYFIRADARMALLDIPGAELDVHEIEKLLEKAGGLSEGDEARLHELEVRILIEKRQLRSALDKVDRSAWLSRKVAMRLKGQIAKAISFDSSGVDDGLKQWALSWEKKTGRH